MMGLPRAKVRRRVAASAALAVLASGVGVVGASGTSAAATGRAHAATAAAVLAQLKAYEGLPKFKAPGPPINARKIMHGKLIVGIPVISSNPFTTDLEAAEQAVAKQIGFTFFRWNNQGTVAEWINGMEYAINHHAALIALDGGSQPKLLAPEIKKAQSHGIIVIDTHETDVAQGKSPYVNFTIPAPYTLAGELMADYAMTDMKGKADALIITSSDVIGSPPFVASIERTFKKYCPGCKYTVTNVPVASWASGLGPAVTGAIERDPGLNYVMPIYDPETQYVLPALLQAHKTGTIHIATFAGTPFVLQDIQSGSVQMDLGENLTWVGYAMLDDEMRLIAHLKPAFPEYLATRVFTPTNIGKSSSSSALYGTAVGNEWLKLWGLK